MTSYEPARWDTPATGCQPGAKALLDAILAGNPWASNLGCFNDRAVRGSSAPSLHREGRAVDVGVNPSSPADVARMDALVEQLTARGDGIQQIIWNRRSWRPGVGWRPYSGASPHTDHAHIELTWAAARGGSDLGFSLNPWDWIPWGVEKGHEAKNAVDDLGAGIKGLVITGVLVAGGVALVVLGMFRQGGNP